MITSYRWIATMGLVLLTAGLSIPAQAQNTSDRNKSDTPTAGPLPDRQAVVRDRVRRFEDRMFELSRVLRKTEPERAAKLLDALGASRSMQIRQKMDGIVEDLQRESYSDAVDEQKIVTSDLEQLLKLLLEDPDQLDQRKEEIERLEKLAETLNNLIEEQKREKAAAEAAAAEAELAEALEAAAKQARELLDRQKKVSSDSDSAARAKAAGDQGAVRKDTESLADDLKALSENSAADAEEKPAGDPEDQEGSAKEAAAKDGQGSGQQSPGGSEGGDCAGAAAADVGEAAKKMKSAEKKLGDDDAPAAKKDQEAAEQKLQDAIDKLEDEAREIRNKLELEKQAEDQRNTAEKTRELAEEMKGESGKDGAGGQKGGEGEGSQQQQQGGQEGQDGQQQQGGSEQQQQGDQNNQPAPGQQDVEGAIPLQEDAADELDTQDPADAAKKQQEALDKLEQAQDELEDVLEQLRREQQEELLAALEARFRAMLAQQLDANKRTDRLADVGPANWKRSDQLELGELSEKQRWVGTEAGKALEVLVEDGTTVVFPQVIEQVRDDALDLAGRIASAEVGHNVRATQLDLAETIRQLLDAVKKMQQENQDGGGGGGGGPNSPLLPGSAELKLLKACQLRVNRATDGVSIDRLMPDVTIQDITKRLSKLDTRQKHVAGMAKDMHETMTRAQ